MNIQQAFEGVGAGGMFSIATNAFANMAVAESEIKKAMKKYPKKAALIDGAFLTLMPHHPLPEKLYRVHCQELLARVATGEDVRTGTDAECMLLLSESSLAFPLRQDYVMVYERLFKQWFPDDHKLFFGVMPHETQETYPGAYDITLAYIRHKLYCKDRAEAKELHR